jgi:hypothetical protein
LFSLVFSPVLQFSSGYLREIALAISPVLPGAQPAIFLYIA